MQVLKLNDTLYLYFDEGKFQVKKEHNKGKQGTITNYYYYFNDSVLPGSSIMFVGSRYLNVNKRKAGIEADVKVVEKKFFKKKKNNIRV